MKNFFRHCSFVRDLCNPLGKATNAWFVQCTKKKDMHFLMYIQTHRKCLFNDEMGEREREKAKPERNYLSMYSFIETTMHRSKNAIEIVWIL